MAAAAHRIEQHRLDELVRPDQEDGAHRLVGGRGPAFGRPRFTRREHAVELGDVQVMIADDWVADLASGRVLDVGEPAIMVAHRVHRQADDLAVALFELGLDSRSEEHTSELQSLMRISYAVFCLKNKKYKNRLNRTS